MALLPCPWAGSEPRSTEQPNLSVKLRTFTCFLKRCVKGIEAYPYEPLPGKPDQIPYYEMLGLGPPPKDVPGNPGDIYIDQVSPIVLYVRNRNQWEKWNDPLVADNEIDGFFPASHPLIANRYLGKTSSSRRLSWYMGSSLWAAGLSVRRPIRLVACNDSVGGFRFESTVSKEPHKTPSTLVPSQPRSTGSISISRSPYKKRKIEEVDLMKESSVDPNAQYDHLTEESPDVILLKESSNDSLHSSDASIVASAKDLLAYVSCAEEKQRLLSKREKAAIDKLTRGIRPVVLMEVCIDASPSGV
ncbi:hypothetical protein J132_07658 [Termitomyces sp. J132]|nr:hypothetical protein J132_07658 [Termitomyces sp. J132]